MGEDALVYITRGLPGTLERAVVGSLVDHLGDQPSFPTPLLKMLESAASLMIPHPEYDITDFDEAEILKSLDALVGGDRTLWAQLLDALNDRHSPEFKCLKKLSPYKGEWLAFADVDGDAAKVNLDLEADLGAELLNRSGANVFPGNAFMVIIPEECLDKLQFVATVNDVPATV